MMAFVCLVHALDDINFFLEAKFSHIEQLPIGYQIVANGYQVGRYYPKDYHSETYRGKVFIYNPNEILTKFGDIVLKILEGHFVLLHGTGRCVQYNTRED